MNLTNKYGEKMAAVLSSPTARTYLHSVFTGNLLTIGEIFTMLIDIGDSTEEAGNRICRWTNLSFLSRQHSIIKLSDIMST
jgi:hypothetical protein